MKELGTMQLNSVNPESVFEATKVFVNGRWIGIHSNPADLVGKMKLMRRNGLINIFIISVGISEEMKFIF